MRPAASSVDFDAGGDVLFTAVGSGVVLKRHYSWAGIVLHIFGQILIWLSIFVMSLAAVLYAGAG